MKKKVIPFLSLTIFMVSKAFATTVADIPTIRDVGLALSADVANLLSFADQLQILNEANFIVTVANSTQTVTLTNAQKSGLIAQYQNIKKKMQDDFALLP